MSIETLLKTRPGADEPVRMDAQLWAAVVAEDAATVNDQVRVRIPDADAGEHLHGPCWFTDRDGTFPSEGDPCLVAFDSSGDPWIVCWGPAS